MAGVNFTTVLARLLSEQAYREEFFANQESAVGRLEISPAEKNALRQLDAIAVRQQAEGLISKRYRHVGELLPATVGLMQETAWRLFQVYANQFWPSTHRRHFEDALHFAVWLSDKKQPVEQAEINRLRHHLAGKRWSVYWLTRIAGKRRWGFQVIIDRRGFREWILSIGL